MSVAESDRLREYVDALQEQVTHLKDAADQAREETSAQVRARIEQAKADAAAGCGCRAWLRMPPARRPAGPGPVRSGMSRPAWKWDGRPCRRVTFGPARKAQPAASMAQSLGSARRWRELAARAGTKARPAARRWAGPLLPAPEILEEEA
jgi:hypothetical protein